MSQRWKRIERCGVCHYPEFISADRIYIVSVDNFETLAQMMWWRYGNTQWHEEAERYRGNTWFVVVFDEPSLPTINRMSSLPFATLEEAVRFAEEKIPTRILWEDASTQPPAPNR